MKRGMLCLLLLSGCWPDYEPPVEEYALTWTCRSSDGCERTEEVERIDRATTRGTDARFTSTQDPTFAEDTKLVFTDLLPRGCAWLYFLSLFGDELERSMLCFGPATFQWELAIPNEDPTTQSMWLVEGRYVDLL